jgi:hypothetical protein
MPCLLVSAVLYLSLVDNIHETNNLYHELNAKLHPVTSRHFCASIDMITAYGISIYTSTCRACSSGNNFLEFGSILYVSILAAQVYRKPDSVNLSHITKQTNYVAFSPQANYTD